MASIPATSIVGSLPQEDSLPNKLDPQVAAAVRTLNEAGYPGADREVTYSVDPASRMPVVRVIESSTKEVITQWPPAYVLDMAAQELAQQANAHEAVGD